MKVKFLGSSAAEGWPALFCECKACVKARELGGKNLRTRTSYLIDEDTLIDFGPDILLQTQRFSIDTAKIKQILFTHSHHDHLNTVDLLWRTPYYSMVSGKIKIFANQHVMDRIENELHKTFGELKLKPLLVKAGKTYKAGRLRISVLEAAHSTEDEQALNFVISDGKSTLLIANDTGWWPEQTWRQIENFKLDAAIIENTSGCHPKYRKQSNVHLGGDIVLEMRNELVRLGCMTTETPVTVNHFSHNSLSLHKDLSKFFKPHGIKVGFDGLELKI